MSERGSRGRSKVVVIPTTQPKANAFINRTHRHHAAMPAGFAWYCLAAVVDGRVCGVAMCGRPSNRNNDDGQTVEALRVASDGTPNVCSALLGAAANAAKAIGARRIITYTLSQETGASLRGAGWVCTDSDTGRSFWANNNSRPGAIQREHMAQSKARWERVFRDRVEVMGDEPAAVAGGLFGQVEANGEAGRS